MYYLGISAFYHDSAAVLLKDGKVVVAIEEERLSRVKHDNSFPKLAVEYCLNYAGISINDIECVAYYEKPLKKLERILETFVRKFPFGVKSFLVSFPEQLTKKILVEKIIRKDLKFSGRIFYSQHHLSHTAATYFTSPFSQAAILTVDGVGEYETTSLWLAKNNELKLLKSISFPHSLGLWYSTFTSFLGFRVNDDEYKVMGMAAYGEPKYLKEVEQTILIKEDGSFALDLDYFNFEFSEKMWSDMFIKLFGEPRLSKDAIEQKHYDIAASLQKVFENIYLQIINQLQIETGQINLCLGGGVALNAKANGLVTEYSDFKNLYIFGASGDSGAALGAALLAWHQTNHTVNHQNINNLDWGRDYSETEVQKVLEKYSNEITYEKVSSEKLVTEMIALLKKQMVVGCFWGRSEFGPRALGYRSILASPSQVTMKDKLNQVKGREQFRPFGGVVLKDSVSDYFLVGKDTDLPFMNVCKLAREESYSSIPALIHQDGTSRIQTITEQNGFMFDLLSELKSQGEAPCLINTSYNRKGEPIVETPQEALELFINSNIEVLVIDGYLVKKKLYNSQSLCRRVS